MEQKNRVQTSPMDVRNTIEWLIQIEDYTQARSLALTFSRYLPQAHPETSDFLAMTLHRTKHYAEALKWAEETARLAPDSIEARYNYARCLHSAGHSQQAEIEIQRVIDQQPNWADPQLDLAMYLCSQGRAAEARSILLKLRETLPTNDPQRTIVTFNLAWHLLQEGKFREGIKALSVGRKLRVFGSYAENYPKPKIFKGLPLSGKKVLLVGEAGAGDEIITVRFAKALSDQGAVVTWVTGHKLEGLFCQAPGVAKVISKSEEASQSYDYWAPAMDLASILEVGEEDLSQEAYLTAPPRFIEKWKARLPEKGKLKVGLRWQGNPLYEQDLFRSVPFEVFRRFILSDQADFYSLQRDAGLEELSSTDPVIDLSSELQTWEDTAAAISLLDVVITSCTSIAHLSGALGKKTFLFTPMVSYYVWASPGDKSIWYKDVRLFRQKEFHDWTLEAKDIGERLRALTKGRT
jgi:tetratricopeptide (TPR) repeat protein